ncbi:hypothetical protein CEXT_423751 [Caerostris extrusa]|uniref:Uncharacterized protein n=1 Tax=Caerostris extrusa TaxID=172846 RepID=A0AAV4Y0X2_CAEEX|nr:hypothetical protein CEXT_423751 [Caerostris extrusa]
MAVLMEESKRGTFFQCCHQLVKRPGFGPLPGYKEWWQEVKLTTRNYSKHSYSSQCVPVNISEVEQRDSFCFYGSSHNVTNAYDILVDLTLGNTIEAINRYSGLIKKLSIDMLQ